MLPGYSGAKLTTKEQNRIYLATFPKGWGRKFNKMKNIDNTTFDKVDKFMDQQKETADKEHATKERKKKKEEEDKRKPIDVATEISCTKLTAKQHVVQH